MPTFTYRAYDQSGRVVNGSIDAPNEAVAHDRLAARGVSSFQVTQKGVAANALAGGVPKELLPLVTRQLATVISSGTHLAVALDVLASQPLPVGAKRVLRVLGADVRSGVAFSAALSRHPGTFSDFFVQMIKVGEATGDLEGALERVADHLEKVASTRQKVVGSLIYPVSVLVIGLLVTFALLRWVVPQFASVLEGFGSDLPAATQFLVSASEFVQENTLLLLAPFAVLGLVWWLVMRSRRGRELVGEWSLGLPVLGGLMHRGEMATLASTLAAAVNSGASLVMGLELATGSSQNWFLKRRLAEVRSDVEQGKGLKDAFGASGAFSSLFVSMVGVGEESGDLPRMLEKVTVFYDREVEAGASRLVSLLQPVMILVLGFLIGGLAYSLFAPIFSLVTAGPNAI